jgi:hypothetical protein
LKSQIAFKLGLDNFSDDTIMATLGDAKFSDLPLFNSSEPSGKKMNLKELIY